MSTSIDSDTLARLRAQFAFMLDPNFNCAVDSVVPSGPIPEAVFEATMQLTARMKQECSDLPNMSLTACQNLSIDIYLRIELRRSCLINISTQCGEIVYDIAWVCDDAHDEHDVTDQNTVIQFVT